MKNALSRLVLALAISGLALPAAQAQTADFPPAPLDWVSLDEAIQKAEKQSKKVLIDIYAPWCGWCKRLHAEVYTDAKVKKYIDENYLVTRLNIDVEDDTLEFNGYRLNSKMLAGGLGAQGTPTTVFLESNSDYITRLPGFAPAEELLSILQFIATNAYRTQSYQDYVDAQTAKGDDR